MAGEVLNMNDLTLNKHRSKLKIIVFQNRHKTIYQPLKFQRQKIKIVIISLKIIQLVLI